VAAIAARVPEQENDEDEAQAPVRRGRGGTQQIWEAGAARQGLIAPHQLHCTYLCADRRNLSRKCSCSVWPRRTSRARFGRGQQREDRRRGRAPRNGGRVARQPPVPWLALIREHPLGPPAPFVTVLASAARCAICTPPIAKASFHLTRPPLVERLTPRLTTLAHGRIWRKLFRHIDPPRPRYFLDRALGGSALSLRLCPFWSAGSPIFAGLASEKRGS
jgi:hypothetical protein